MANHTRPDGAMETLSTRLPPAEAADLMRLMPDGTKGEALRIAARIGVNVMSKPGFLDSLAADHLLRQARELVDQMPLGRTLSGAHQFEQLPDPGELAASALPAVVTTGEHVLLIDGMGQVLAVSFGAAPEIGVQGLKSSAGGETTIGMIVAITGQLGGALVQLVNDGSGRTIRLAGAVDLALGQSGHVQITFAGVILEVPLVLLWQLMAELNAGIARQMAASVEARQRLEAQLQASTGGQEVQA